MKRFVLAILLGILLLPSVTFAHDWDYPYHRHFYSRDHRFRNRYPYRHYPYYYNPRYRYSYPGYYRYREYNWGPYTPYWYGY